MIAKFLISLACGATLLAAPLFAQLVPAFAELEEVAQLPPDVPQRVGALGFDGKKLWFAIYAGRGKYVTYDPIAKEWDTTQNEKLVSSIQQLTGRGMSPGGFVFVDGKIWVASSFGDSYGSIDIEHPAIVVLYNRRYNSNLTSGQSYSDLTYDGTNLWAAWHATYYKHDGTKTQLLLKIDPGTGDILSEYELTARDRADVTHALAWDGRSIWHAKGAFLTEFDQNGTKRNESRLEKVKRPSGMVWDGNALWIAEFSGKLWRLPFKKS